ncbi:MAG: hypothetical protein U0V70_02730 [Terriglobia bacterium]
MKKISFLVIILNGFVLLGFAQEAQITRSPSDKPGNYRSGIIRTSKYTHFVPEDLADLVKSSPLIVRGVVSMQLPTRCTDESCLSLYTDFEFTVSKVLKDDGTKRKFDKVIVSQDGGKLGDLEVIFDDEVFMQKGEEYILCLIFDPHDERVNYDGARWTMFGFNNGKFKIVDQRVFVEDTSVFRNVNKDGSPNSSPLEGISADTLVSRIESAEAHTTRSTSDNPGDVIYKGIIRPTKHADFTPEDLADLVKWSPLIVRGVISMQLPTRCTDESCRSLYTDFEFTISKGLKLDDPRRKLDKLIVSQDGGKLGDLEVNFVGEVLMREGEEYILCLRPDPNEDRLHYDGARWTIFGFYNGKFKIVNEQVVVEDNSVFKNVIRDGVPNSRSLEGISVDTLVAQIEAALAN